MPSAYISPPWSRGQSLGIDPVQQEIYDYIESLEKREATKRSVPNLSEEKDQFNEPQEPPVLNILGNEIFGLETLNNFIKSENQSLKSHNEVQISKSDKLLNFSLW